MALDFDSEVQQELDRLRAAKTTKKPSVPAFAKPVVAMQEKLRPKTDFELEVEKQLSEIRNEAKAQKRQAAEEKFNAMPDTIKNAALSPEVRNPLTQEPVPWPQQTKFAELSRAKDIAEWDKRNPGAATAFERMKATDLPVEAEAGPESYIPSLAVAGPVSLGKAAVEAGAKRFLPEALKKTLGAGLSAVKTVGKASRADTPDIFRKTMEETRLGTADSASQEMSPLKSFTRSAMFIPAALGGVVESGLMAGRGAVNLPQALLGDEEAQSKVKSGYEAFSRLWNWRATSAGSLAEHLQNMGKNPEEEFKAFLNNPARYSAEIAPPIVNANGLTKPLLKSIKESSNLSKALGAVDNPAFQSVMKGVVRSEMLKNAAKKAALPFAVVADATSGPYSVGAAPATIGLPLVGKAIREVGVKFPDTKIGAMVNRNFKTKDQLASEAQKFAEDQGVTGTFPTREEILNDLAQNQMGKYENTGPKTAAWIKKVLEEEAERKGLDKDVLVRDARIAQERGNATAERLTDESLKSVKHYEDLAARQELRKRGLELSQDIIGENIKNVDAEAAEAMRQIRTNEAIQKAEHIRGIILKGKPPAEQVKILKLSDAEFNAKKRQGDNARKISVLQNDIDAMTARLAGLGDKALTPEQRLVADQMILTKTNEMNLLREQIKASTAEQMKAKNELALAKANEMWNEEGIETPMGPQNPERITTDNLYEHSFRKTESVPDQVLMDALPVYGEGGEHGIASSSVHLFDAEGNMLADNVIVTGPDGKTSPAQTAALAELLQKHPDAQVKVELEALQDMDTPYMEILGQQQSAILNNALSIKRMMGQLDAKSLAEELRYVNHQAGYVAGAADKPIRMGATPDDSTIKGPINERREADPSKYVNIGNAVEARKARAHYEAEVLAQRVNMEAAMEFKKAFGEKIKEQQFAKSAVLKNKLPGRDVRAASVDAEITQIKQTIEQKQAEIALSNARKKQLRDAVAKAEFNKKVATDPAIIALDEEIASLEAAKNMNMKGANQAYNAAVKKRLEAEQHFADTGEMIRKAGESAEENAAKAKQILDGIEEKVRTDPAVMKAEARKAELQKAIDAADEALVIAEMTLKGIENGDFKQSAMRSINFNKLTETGKQFMLANMDEANTNAHYSTKEYPVAFAELMENMWFSKEKMGWTGLLGGLPGNYGKAGRGIGQGMDWLQRKFVRNILFSMPAELNPTSWGNFSGNLSRAADLSAKMGLENLPNTIMETAVDIASSARRKKETLIPQKRTLPDGTIDVNPKQVTSLNYSLAPRWEADSGIPGKTYGDMKKILGGDESLGADALVNIELGDNWAKNKWERTKAGAKSYFNQNAESYGFGPTSDFMFKIAAIKELTKNGMDLPQAVKVAEDAFFAYHNLPAFPRKLGSTALPFFNWTYAATVPLAEMYGRFLPVYNAAFMASRAGQQIIADREGIDLRKVRKSLPLMYQNGFYLGNQKWGNFGRFTAKTMPLDMSVKATTEQGADPSVLGVAKNLMQGASPQLQTLNDITTTVGGGIPKSLKFGRPYAKESDPFLSRYAKIAFETVAPYIVPGTIQRFVSQTVNADKDGKYTMKSGRSYDLPDRLRNLGGISTYELNAAKANSVLQTILNSVKRKMTDKEDPESIQRARDAMKRILEQSKTKF